jgi:ZIP family zinc transporter
LAGAALPAALGFAAGAMLYVVVDELIPESHAGGHELAATLALLAGFALMVTLDTTL